MTTKECPACAMDVDARLKKCHICGYEFPVSNTGIKVIAIFLILVFIYLIFF